MLQIMGPITAKVGGKKTATPVFNLWIFFQNGVNNLRLKKLLQYKSGVNIGCTGPFSLVSLRTVNTSHHFEET